MSENYTLEEIIDIEKLTEIFNKFSDLTGISARLISYPSQKTLIKTGWQKVCERFHHKNEGSIENCTRCQNIILNELKDYTIFSINECDNGLIDGATPIIINHKLIGVNLSLWICPFYFLKAPFYRHPV